MFWDRVSFILLHSTVDEINISNITLSTRLSDVIINRWSQCVSNSFLNSFPNRWTKSSSQRRGCLPRELFRSLGYHSASPRPTQLYLCFRYSAITSFAALRSRIISFRICSCNNIHSIDISDLSMAVCVLVNRCSLFVIA